MITLYWIHLKGQQRDTTPLGNYNQVAVAEDFFDIIYQAHYEDSGHSGAKKTLAKASPSESSINPMHTMFNTLLTTHYTGSSFVFLCAKGCSGQICQSLLCLSKDDTTEP